MNACKTQVDAVVDLVIVIDFEDLFTDLTTQFQSFEKAIHVDGTVKRFDFDTSAFSELVRVCGNFNISDSETIFDSSLIPAVNNMP